ncbi:hypothetical protein HK102_000842 [Quaeritorhiza haematococci]|nr:hypothetical protein HK102_000842 [Quaeritorhiza haematococci]
MATRLETLEAAMSKLVSQLENSIPQPAPSKSTHSPPNINATKVLGVTENVHWRNRARQGEEIQDQRRVADNDDEIDDEDDEKPVRGSPSINLSASSYPHHTTTQPTTLQDHYIEPIEPIGSGKVLDFEVEAEAIVDEGRGNSVGYVGAGTEVKAGSAIKDGSPTRAKAEEYIKSIEERLRQTSELLRKKVRTSKG